MSSKIAFSSIGPVLAKSWRPLLALAVLMVAPLASTPARAGTPSEPINTVTPVTGPNLSVVCGAECLDCCLCCTPGMPQNMLTTAYQQHRNGFILGSFYSGTAEPAFRSWATQLTQAWLFQARMIGGFYDGQNSSRAQLELQRRHAEALRDYTPSEAICQFGTLSRSLNASEEKSRSAQIILSQVNLNRSLGTFGNVGSAGRGQDAWDRMANFTSAFCDTTDNDNALTVFCDAPVPPDVRLNRDIDYARTLAIPETLQADLTNNTVSLQENNLILLGHNLYGHRQFIKRIDEDDVKSGTGQNLVQLMRSVEAKRALAQNSFNAYAGMKTQGSGASYTYMDTVLRNLGLSVADRDTYFGTITPPSGPAPAGTPSYYAQMDIMTKRIYQNPGFYAQLMDKRANVSRQQAAMEGLELMQRRDIFTSMSRSEQLLALLVEMEAIKLQSKVQNNTTTK